MSEDVCSALLVSLWTLRMGRGGWAGSEGVEETQRLSPASLAYTQVSVRIVWAEG